MPEIPGSELQVWTARTSDFGPAMPRDLDALLDAGERERAARFKHEADRRPYVLVHALRRAVLARWLAVDPRDVVLSREPGGRPLLLEPCDDGLYFSHSRSRDAVALAVTRLAPLGVDVETVKPKGGDDSMISRFVVLDDDVGQPANQDERASRFYFHWTALEAFWKAQGKGLADGNPRIRCVRSARGDIEVWLESGGDAPQARLVSIPDSSGSCITLAVLGNADVHPQLCNGNMQLFNACLAHEMLSPR
jgi:phosphopantetheinyl transferase